MAWSHEGCDACWALISLAHDFAESETFRGGAQHVANVLCQEIFKEHKEGLQECNCLMEFLVPELQSRVVGTFEDASELCTDLYF